MSKGILLVISAPSGGGKTTLANGLLEKVPQMSYSVSVTTRSPRAGESEGVDYFYITEKEFIEKKNSGELLEHAFVHGYWYGTPRPYIEENLKSGKDVLLDIDVQGGRQIKEKMRDAILVFIVPPSLQALEARLRGRQKDDEATIQRRLERARQEIEESSNYDFLVLNDELSHALDQLYSIYKAEKLRMSRSRSRILNLLNTSVKEPN